MNKREELAMQLLHYANYVDILAEYNMYNADFTVPVKSLNDFRLSLSKSFLNKLPTNVLRNLAESYDKYVSEFNEPNNEDEHGRFWEGCQPVCLLEYYNEDFQIEDDEEAA